MACKAMRLNETTKGGDGKKLLGEREATRNDIEMLAKERPRDVEELELLYSAIGTIILKTVWKFLNWFNVELTI